MSALTARVLLRQIGADRWVAALLVALVGVTSGLVLTALRTVDDVSTQAIRAGVNGAGPGIRDLVGTAVVSPLPSAATDPAGAYDELVDRVEQGPAADVAAVARPARWQLQTTTLTAVEPLPRGGPTRRLVLRVDPSALASMRVVEGRLPAGRPQGASPPTGTYEIVVTALAAELMNLELGDVVSVVSLVPDARVPELRLHLVGLVEPTDPQDDAWAVDPSALRPRLAVTSGPLGNIRTGVAFAGVEALPELARELSTAPTTLTVRVPVRGDALEPADATDLVAGARRATARPIAVEAPEGGATMFFATRLDDVLEQYLRQRVPVLALAVLLLVSLVAVALVVMLLAIRLLLDRRRTELALATARGTSTAQVVTLFVLEGVLLGVPGALTGAWAASQVPGEAGGWTVLVPVLAGLAPAVVLGLSAVPAVRATPARGQGRARSRGDDLSRSDGRSRSDVLARQGSRAGLILLLAVTAAAVVSLRGRGAGALLDVDPLVVVTPVLVAVAAAVVMGRALSHPLDWATRRAAGGRGAVAFLGLARASRAGGIGALALVALVLGLSMSLLAAITDATVTRATRDAAVHAVGAPLRVNGFGYVAAEEAALAALPGVEAVAAVTTLHPVQVESGPTGTRSAEVTVLATDPERLADVQSGLVGAPALLPAVARAVAAGGGPQPAGVVSRDVLVEGRAPRVGDVVRATVSQRAVEIRVVGVMDGLAGAPVLDPWVLVDLDALRQSTRLVLAPQTLLARTDPALGGGPPQEDVVAAVGEVASVVTPASLAERATSAPLPRALRTALAPAAGVGAGYAAAAVVLTLLLGSRARAAFIAHLRAVGLDARQAGSLVALEVVPAALAALVTGLAVGTALAHLVLPVTDLRALTAAVVAPVPRAGALLLVAYAVGFVAVVATSVVVAVVAGRRVSPAAAARVEEGG